MWMAGGHVSASCTCISNKQEFSTLQGYKALNGTHKKVGEELQASPVGAPHSTTSAHMVPFKQSRGATQRKTNRHVERLPQLAKILVMSQTHGTRPQARPMLLPHVVWSETHIHRCLLRV